MSGRQSSRKKLGILKKKAKENEALNTSAEECQTDEHQQHNWMTTGGNYTRSYSAGEKHLPWPSTFEKKQKGGP